MFMFLAYFHPRAGDPGAFDFTHRELAGGGEIDDGVRPGGGEQGGELAGGDEDEAADYELAVAVADLPELLLDPPVVLQHGGDVGEPPELAREPHHPQDLKVADDAEENADHEEERDAGRGGSASGSSPSPARRRRRGAAQGAATARRRKTAQEPAAARRGEEEWSTQSHERQARKLRSSSCACDEHRANRDAAGAGFPPDGGGSSGDADDASGISWRALGVAK
nr:unnamed protein product [Digitaria exilis]